jgi:hypothetical protein
MAICFYKVKKNPQPVAWITSKNMFKNRATDCVAISNGCVKESAVFG